MENIPTSINYNAKCKFQGNFIIEKLYCIEKNMGILTCQYLKSKQISGFFSISQKQKTPSLKESGVNVWGMEPPLMSQMPVGKTIKAWHGPVITCERSFPRQ
jgi:hypothetical protein